MGTKREQQEAYLAIDTDSRECTAIFCIDFSKFLGKGDCTLQRNALRRPEAGRTKEMFSKAMGSGSAACSACTRVEWRERTGGPGRMIPVQSSGTPVTAASAGTALPVPPKPLLPWSTVSISLFLILLFPAQIPFSPHPLLQVSSQNSASSSSLST